MQKIVGKTLRAARARLSPAWLRANRANRLAFIKSLPINEAAKKKLALDA